MKEPYGEGPTTHTCPQSCADARKGGRELLTGGRKGRVFSRQSLLRSNDAVKEKRKAKSGASISPDATGLRARSETPSMPEHTSRENRGSPWSPSVDGTGGRIGKSTDVRR